MIDKKILDKLNRQKKKFGLKSQSEVIRLHFKLVIKHALQKDLEMLAQEKSK